MITNKIKSNQIGHPVNIGILHFVGIGGIGMSGIAEVMHNFGYKVQGSDISENANVERLRKLGIKVYLGQRNKNLEGAWGIVVSTAIKPDNPEVVAAKAMKMPLIKRSEMLAELMRLKWCVSVAGTHGKTTTTTMVSAVLDEANYDPTVINGGIINAYGTNARLGEGDWMVVEADESDGTFIKIPSTVAVVTNIDPEHLDFYGDFENAKTAFEMFIKNVPFYGFSVMCIDHPEVQALIGKVIDRRIITYGFSVQAEVRGTNILFDEGSAHFDVEISNGNDGDLSFLRNIVMPMPGRHNISNALAAIAVSYELGISADIIRRTFSKFSGVKRRFTIVDKVEDIIIIDDYAHHPVEITSVLSAAREAYSGRVIAVVQPHRYTRLESLFDEFCSCFNNADTVIVAPVFDAGEQPIKGANQDDLISGLQRSGHREVIKINEPKELPKIISNIAVAGDLVIYLGAGSISSWAYLLPDALRRLKTQ
ncbi:MAG: UDP-N-acetylmuramate--L-alanine ligase [Emcibacteraceae bacterium]|jgi:UDP-N-acetylmuramate--alanine ligase|nr:UDP-N-acetylmuramate--L-alanine ligase [Emcibacteraceae bacterium]MDC0112126.1 UDP-N-acetylmuramate--L-alanine ligase [Emcibacteraceae bacterium]MDC1429533.1 UDP-N-acetylmuramate--L-alanine ligase [Emcibacteraceae bacterium]|tara:strand:+ start:36 stop:1475 length:1440 start_codon:yes stop_codon:yes gene_type:complete